MKKNNGSVVIRDWTNETLVVDLVNSLGEKYHFEVPPNVVDKLTTRGSNSPLDKTNKGVFVEAHIPIPAQLDFFKNESETE